VSRAAARGATRVPRPRPSGRFPHATVSSGCPISRPLWHMSRAQDRSGRIHAGFRTDLPDRVGARRRRILPPRQRDAPYLHDLTVASHGERGRWPARETRRYSMRTGADTHARCDAPNSRQSSHHATHRPRTSTRRPATRLRARRGMRVLRATQSRSDGPRCARCNDGDTQRDGARRAPTALRPQR